MSRLDVDDDDDDDDDEDDDDDDDKGFDDLGFKKLLKAISQNFRGFDDRKDVSVLRGDLPISVVLGMNCRPEESNDEREGGNGEFSKKLFTSWACSGFLPTKDEDSDTL